MHTLVFCIIVVTTMNFSAFLSIVSVPPRLENHQIWHLPRLYSTYFIQYVLYPSPWLKFRIFLPSPRLLPHHDYTENQSRYSKNITFISNWEVFFGANYSLSYQNPWTAVDRAWQNTAKELGTWNLSNNFQKELSKYFFRSK